MELGPILNMVVHNPFCLLQVHPSQATLLRPFSLIHVVDLWTLYLTLHLSLYALIQFLA